MYLWILITWSLKCKYKLLKSLSLHHISPVRIAKMYSLLYLQPLLSVLCSKRSSRSYTKGNHQILLKILTVNYVVFFNFLPPKTCSWRTINFNTNNVINLLMDDCELFLLIKVMVIIAIIWPQNAVLTMPFFNH